MSLLARRLVVEIRPEDDGVGLGELRHGAAVQTWKVVWIALLHPDGGGVVVGIEGALCDAVSDAGEVIVPSEVT